MYKHKKYNTLKFKSIYFIAYCIWFECWFHFFSCDTLLQSCDIHLTDLKKEIIKKKKITSIKYFV